MSDTRLVNGTNGESVLLTVDERKEVAAKWYDLSNSNQLFFSFVLK